MLYCTNMPKFYDNDDFDNLRAFCRSYHADIQPLNPAKLRVLVEMLK